MVDVSHLSLQVYLGPIQQELSYDIGMSFTRGQYEGSPVILRKTMREDSNYHVM